MCMPLERCLDLGGRPRVLFCLGLGRSREGHVQVTCQVTGQVAKLWQSLYTLVSTCKR